MGSVPLTVPQRRVVAAALAVLVLVVVLWRHMGHRAPAAAPPVPWVAREAPPAEKQLLVDVVGAVGRPGLYRLAQGARVADAVRLAGGLTRKADPLGVNLAAPVADGEQVVVAARGAGGVAAAGGGSQAAPVSLSSATAEQLDALPGVGPVTAQKIVAYRQQHGPFRSVDELDAIAGIGPARIQDLQGLVVP